MNTTNHEIHKENLYNFQAIVLFVQALCPLCSFQKSLLR
jgi:hypothetical protein